MIFWFIGTAVLTVWYVFRDPSFDYRLLVIGAVLPVFVDPLFGESACSTACRSPSCY